MEEGGWAGLGVLIGGAAPSAEVTVTCDLVLRAPGAGSALKTDFRADALRIN